MLEQLKEELITCASEISLHDYLEPEHCHVIEPFDVSGHYYKLLIAYCKLKQPKRIIEVGFREGWSARCMSVAVPDAKIASYDLTMQHLNYDPKYDNVIHDTVGPDFAWCELSYDNADFVFIDAEHDGTLEQKILKRILATNFQGYVFWDDIRFNTPMSDFWKQITLPKIEVEEFATKKRDGSSMGFGVTYHEG